MTDIINKAAGVSSPDNLRGAGSGHVDLIGCGPGDPDLLTLKAVKCLRQADVVVTDRLVGEEILSYASPDARRINVGKTPYQPSIGQDEINQILVREAMQGNRVARLKGGDPGIFGRLAEELGVLRAAGISVDIIPGVTAAHACAAEIGLPVTVREAVRQFTVLTATSKSGVCDHDWSSLAKDGHAFAVYMGVKSAGVLAERLLAHGARRDRTVVIVENGTRPEQRTVQTTLGSLDAAIATLAILGPAVIFVGLDWEQANLTRPNSVEMFQLDPNGNAPSDVVRGPEPGQTVLSSPPIVSKQTALS